MIRMIIGTIRTPLKPRRKSFLVGLLVGLTVGLYTYCWPESSLDKPDKPITMDLGTHSETEYFHLMFNKSVAEYLRQEVRVACVVMTRPFDHPWLSYQVKATWGKRCTTLLFMSTETDEILPTIVLSGSKHVEGNTWKKTKLAMRYVYENNHDQADWILTVEDNTYVIMENLRYFLYTKNSSEPFYFGCRATLDGIHGHMDAGAGYVLSKEALRLFIEKALPNSTICSQEDAGDESYEMGKCLAGVGVKLGNSRDVQNKARFFPLTVDSHIAPMKQEEFFSKYHFDVGWSCCSDTAITFHNVSTQQMHAMEYMVYHLTPFGIEFNSLLPNLNVWT